MSSHLIDINSPKFCTSRTTLLFQCWIDPITDSQMSTFRPGIETGWRVQEIRSSRFCPGFYLAQTRELIRHAQV